MVDIFISYAREDRERIRPLAEAFAAEGWGVFWDQAIPPGQTWHSYIGNALNEANAVIVAWTKASIESEFVQEEAQVGRRRRVLVPVRLDEVEPPLGFTLIQAGDLVFWNGSRESAQFRQVCEALTKHLGPAAVRTDEGRRWPLDCGEHGTIGGGWTCSGKNPARTDIGEGGKQRCSRRLAVAQGDRRRGHVFRRCRSDPRSEPLEPPVQALSPCRADHGAAHNGGATQSEAGSRAA